jgi:hypothetical protein
MFKLIFAVVLLALGASPAVPLRITPTPYHDDALVEALCEALVDVWQRLRLKQRALAAE